MFMTMKEVKRKKKKYIVAMICYSFIRLIVATLALLIVFATDMPITALLMIAPAVAIFTFMYEAWIELRILNLMKKEIE